MKRGLIPCITIVLLIVFFSGAAKPKGPVTDAERRQEIEALYLKYKQSFPDIEDISAKEVLRIKDIVKVVLVDVRRPKEQAVSMLPGAITDKVFLLDPMAYRDYLVIGYCTISYRSGNLAKKLRKKGIRMINLRGGILAWLHAGGKIYKNGKQVNQIHVYGKKWDLAPTGYKSIY